MPFRINSNRTHHAHPAAHQGDPQTTAPNHAQPRLRRGENHRPQEPAAAPNRRHWAHLFRRLTPPWQLEVEDWIMEQPLNDEDRERLRGRFVEARSRRRPDQIYLNLTNTQIVSVPPALPPRAIYLVMGNNRLSSLPSDLPSDIQDLMVEGNQLTDLTNSLPSQLRMLLAGGNRLVSVPDRLPSRLNTLDLSNNHLVDISPEAIDCLARLPRFCSVDLDYNPLSPETIERLEQLQNSPEYQGPTINFEVIGLCLSDHNLDSVPHDLPSNLQELILSNNPLTAPINHLPRQLLSLDISHTGQSRLPDELPPNLQRLRADGNRLMTISEDSLNTLIRMGPSATIDLCNNPLSPQTLERLEQLQNSPTYRGPRFTLNEQDRGRFFGPEVPVTQPSAPARAHEPPAPADIGTQNVVNDVLSQLDPETAAGLLDIRRTAAGAGHPISDRLLINMVLDRMPQVQAQADRQPAVQAVPVVPAVRAAPWTGLAAAVSVWRPEPQSSIAPTPGRWQEFCAEPNATAFSIFLARLSTTVNANTSPFRNSVSEWLHHLETNSQLRSDTFTMSVGATASCGDRIFHAFNDMRQLRLASDVSNADYDQRLPELLTLARSMFRLGQLETIARKHAASRPGVDEIEVYLGFQVLLRKRLALPLDTADMHHPSRAEIRPEHLKQAYNRVIAAERKGFADFLANDWSPWQAVLQRQIPVQYEQAQEQLIDAMDEEFSTRLQARLQEIGLDNDPDAQRTLGPVVQAEIAREIKGPLTRDFLRSKGLHRHLR